MTSSREILNRHFTYVHFGATEVGWAWLRTRGCRCRVAGLSPDATEDPQSVGADARQICQGSRFVMGRDYSNQEQNKPSPSKPSWPMPKSIHLLDIASVRGYEIISD
ncbi:hypothetical protein TNCV_3660451 [Trichonephila clavipes]|nr:hypothetical protein TNCV_3660451 [Trichonephila clavipes]